MTNLIVVFRNFANARINQGVNIFTRILVLCNKRCHYLESLNFNSTNFITTRCMVYLEGYLATVLTQKLPVFMVTHVSSPTSEKPATGWYAISPQFISSLFIRRITQIACRIENKGVTSSSHTFTVSRKSFFPFPCDLNALCTHCLKEHAISKNEGRETHSIKWL